MSQIPAARPAPQTDHMRLGVILVAGSAVIWSFVGAIARFIDISDNWTVVFWRSIFAAVFLLAFMLLRDGPAGTLKLKV